MRDQISRLRRLEISFRPKAREPTEYEHDQYMVVFLLAGTTGKETPKWPEDVQRWFDEQPKDEETERRVRTMSEKQMEDEILSHYNQLSEKYKDNEKFNEEVTAQLDLLKEKKASKSKRAAIDERKRNEVLAVTT